MAASRKVDPLRVGIVLSGVFMVVYCGGGVAASVLDSGFQWLHGTLIAGLVTGLVLLTWSGNWTHPLAARAALMAFATGAAAAFLSVPAIMVMAWLFDTRSFDLYLGVIVPPLAYIGGLVVGGAAVLLRGRRAPGLTAPLSPAP